jgi:D-glycero-D-manno-heptose 1,7-bisphosphate phosphatase
VLSAVFLDRDGVINQNRDDHVKCWEEFHFVSGATEAVARFSRAGVRVFVVTNQAIINRGIASGASIEAMHDRMRTELGRHGGLVEAVAYCPHRSEEQCACRKPSPGLLFELARRYAVDLGSAALVGDALTDIEAGQAAGCRTVLVLTGRGRDELARATADGKGGFLVAADVGEASEMLLRSSPVDTDPKASVSILAAPADPL